MTALFWEVKHIILPNLGIVNRSMPLQEGGTGSGGRQLRQDFLRDIELYGMIQCVIPGVSITDSQTKILALSREEK